MLNETFSMIFKHLVRCKNKAENSAGLAKYIDVFYEFLFFVNFLKRKKVVNGFFSIFVVIKRL